MKKSQRTLEIEARRAADPIAQALGREDIDYSSDDLPTAPRTNYRGTPTQLSPNPDPNAAPMDEPDVKHCETCTCGESPTSEWRTPNATTNS